MAVRFSEAPVFQVFRFRVLVAPEQRVELNPHHGATVYATLAAAYGIAADCDPVLPEGVMVEAPEQGRLTVEAGEQLAFGWTLIAAGSADARLRSTRLIEGLRKLGARARTRRKSLTGGFQVTSVQDFIAGRDWDRSASIVGVDHARLEPWVAELSQRLQQQPLTIRLTTPLRMSRPKSKRSTGHAFFDSQWFGSSAWLGRLKTRLAGLGLAAICPATTPSPAQAGVEELVWIDIPYQGSGGQKTLGGVVGKVELGHVDPEWAAALVWCQLLGVGESTRMGLGRYQICGLPTVSDPAARRDDAHAHDRIFSPLPRWRSLVDLALSPAAIDRGAARYQLPAGATVQATQAIRGGTYQPESPHRFELRDGDRRPRSMCVPSRRDRAIQQALLESIAPALDRFFESSSFAFRKGLGRHSAARHIERVSRQGYTWAVRSDIHRFFDEVDHRVLRARIEAYLPDPKMVALLMSWVTNRSLSDESEQDGKGLPTGAPVSPVLANLLLDQFDEQVATEGARLVRYADDFLILHKSEDQAKAALQTAEHAASQLQLKLSEPKTSLLSPGESFDFLGFHFSPDDNWRFHAMLPVTELPGLGWVDLSVSKARPPSPEAQFRLPGESERAKQIGGVVAVLAGRVTKLDARPGRLIARDRADRLLRDLSCRRMSFVLVQGTPEVTSAAWRQIIEHQIDMMMVGPSGRPRCQIRTRPQSPSTSARIVQVRLASDAAAALPAARRLVHAKLHNTATTCRALFRDPDGVTTSQQLLELAERALSATDHACLLGYEGGGAAAWYRLFGTRLPKPFRFDRREAPRSRSPGNVLLNIVYSHLHRLCEAAAIAAGLMPDLGLLHRPRSGHLALASDLQEPFRHLGDRAVFIAASRISASDFSEQPNHRYPLRLQPLAMRRLFEILYRTLSVGCEDQSGVNGSYREHIFRQARNVRRTLADPQQALTVFLHP
ncbi:MAG: CRISPR-associated endonuclease Cas1 [Pirellulaceae bacterium]